MIKLNRKLLLTLFFDTRCFTLAFAEVKQFGATNTTYFDDFNAVDVGRIDRECTLNPYVVAHFAHGEGLRVVLTLTLDNHAFEGLDTLFVTFLDFVIHSNAIAGFEGWHLLSGSKLFVYELYGLLHLGSILDGKSKGISDYYEIYFAIFRSSCNKKPLHEGTVF